MFYTLSAEQFSNQLWDGELYPRWLFDLNAGIGSPVFYFYAPFAFYISALFSWVSSINDAAILLPIVLTAWVANVASGIAAYCWLKNHLQPSHARIGALLYSFTIIAVHYSVKELGIASLCARFWIVAILVACDRFIQRPDSRSMAILSISFAGLMFSHFFIWIIFGCIPFLYCMLLGKPTTRSVFFLLLAYIIGIALSSIYWLPAFINSSLLTHSSLYKTHFAEYGINNISGLFFVSLLPSFILISIYIYRNRMNLLSIERFSIVICLIFLPVITPFSQPLWDNINFLQMFEFPFRFGFGFIPFIILLTFKAIEALPEGYTARAVNSYLMFLVFVSIALSGDYYSVPAKNSDYVTLKPNHALEYRTKWAKALDTDIGRYADANYELLTQEYNSKLKSSYTDLPLMQAIDGDAYIESIIRENNQIYTKINVTSAKATLELRQLYYPNWTAEYADSRNIPIDISDNTGFIKITLPVGSHNVIFTISPPYANIAFIICIVGLFTLMIMSLYDTVCCQRKTHNDI